MEFKLGDKVTMNPESEYWREDSSSNPRNIEGEVINVYGNGSGHCLSVMWSNNRSNTYRHDDLLPSKPVVLNNYEIF